MRLFTLRTFTRPGAAPGRVRIVTAHDVDLLASELRRRGQRLILLFPKVRP